MLGEDCAVPLDAADVDQLAVAGQVCATLRRLDAGVVYSRHMCIYFTPLSLGLFCETSCPREAGGAEGAEEGDGD